MARRSVRIIDVVAYLLWAGIALRGLRDYASSPNFWIVVGLLMVFVLLSISQYWFHRRIVWYLYLYFPLQVCLVLVLSLLSPYQDYFIVLYIFLSLEVMSSFSQRTAFVWIGVFSVATTCVLLYSFGAAYAVPMIVMYVAAFLFFASYAAVTKQAEQAREDSLVLLSQLQTAHRDLQAYADQVEELAAAEERNRLARELHDSVTQTIFSMTLVAESTRILLERDPTRVEAQLDRIQKLAQEALAEMRSLILQLRPKTVADEGLITALRWHIAERGKHDGLTVSLYLEGVEEGDKRLPLEIEQALFRIAQEALNNVIKHAQTDRAEVRLCFGPRLVSLQIEDRGVGFDPLCVGSGASHLGLTGMRERVRVLKGRLEIDSQPQAGTRIKVEIPFDGGEA